MMTLLSPLDVSCTGVVVVVVVVVVVDGDIEDTGAVANWLSATANGLGCPLLTCST